MNLSVQTPDLVLTAIVLVGMLQVAWLSVALFRRRVARDVIQKSIPPLFAIWVVMWPIYHDPRWIWAGIGMLACFVLLPLLLRRPFWRDLRRAWAAPPSPVDYRLKKPTPFWPLAFFVATLGIAAGLFQSIPEFGLGIALTVCLAQPAASWLDHFGFLALGFPAHPQQTLPGHLLLVLAAAGLCSWSVHVYHGIDWQPLLMATSVAGIAASVARALVPGSWNQPAAAAAMGVVLWLL
ncbi:MAG TPA: hypothetical protein VNH42_01180 [Mariprofundaceae bacterium]|nr:hypothetical protein [Mariprofundaceae bacterium]